MLGYMAYISRVYWYTAIMIVLLLKFSCVLVVPAWVRLDSCGLSLDGAVFRVVL